MNETPNGPFSNYDEKLFEMPNRANMTIPCDVGPTGATGVAEPIIPMGVNGATG